MPTTRKRAAGRTSRKGTSSRSEAALQESIEPVYVAAGAAIAEIRRQRALTQDDLSEAASMSQNQLARIERGMRRVSLAQLARLAAALGASVHDLLPMTDPTSDVRLPSTFVESWKRLSAADRRLLGTLAERLAAE